MGFVEKMKAHIGADSATNIRSLLPAGHQQISAPTKRIGSDASWQQRFRAFDQLKPLRWAYARAEKQAMYIPLAELRGSPDTRADANEAFVEHSLVDV